MALALLTKLCPKGATSIGLMCLELGLALKNIRTDLKPGLVKPPVSSRSAGQASAGLS
jgi:hypothetical protein